MDVDTSLSVSRMLSKALCTRSLWRGLLMVSNRSVHSTSVQRSIPKKLDEHLKNFEGYEEGTLYGYNHIIRKKGLFKPQHTVEEQIKYMHSKVFEETYKGEPIWKSYKRNIFGQWKFQGNPRLFCISTNNRFNTNNPCPVCRDQYLFFDYRNPELLKQFMQNGTDEPLALWTVGLCRDQYVKLKAEVLKAKEYGTIIFMIPFRNFKYRDYYPWYTGKEPVAVPELPGDFEDLKERPLIEFPIHRRDMGTDWDEYWKRWDEFAIKRR